MDASDAGIKVEGADAGAGAATGGAAEEVASGSPRGRRRGAAAGAAGAGGAGAGAKEAAEKKSDELNAEAAEQLALPHKPIGDSNQPLIGEDEMGEFRTNPTHDAASGRRLNVAEAEVVGRRTKYLAIMGKRFPMDLTGGELTIHGAPVFISEKANVGEGTGLTVWDGSIVLAKYLERAFTHQFTGRSVLELGAGTGVVGIVASVLGAKRVVLTDLDYTLDNARANVEKNRMSLKGDVEVMELDWFKPLPKDLGQIDYVLASDVVWVESLIMPLVDTLVRLTTRPDDAPHSWTAPTVVLCHQTRTVASDKTFFDELALHFEVSQVPYEDHHMEYRDHKVFIYELHRKDAGASAPGAVPRSTGSGSRPIV